MLSSAELRAAIRTHGMSPEDEHGHVMPFGAELYRRLPELAALWQAVEVCHQADDDTALEHGSPPEESEPTRRLRALAEQAHATALEEPCDVLEGQELGERDRALQATHVDLLANLRVLVEREPASTSDSRLAQRFLLDRGTIRRWRGKQQR